MKPLIDEFKTFILKGNVVDLAVGVMIGAAFADIVKAFTHGIVNPLLAKFGGAPTIHLVYFGFDFGMVINAIISFLITAAIIFFLIVKPMGVLLAKMKKQEAEAPPPPPPADVKLLTEIRDLLKQK